jgi:sugar lactone lactonase YvrE
MRAWRLVQWVGVTAAVVAGLTVGGVAQSAKPNAGGQKIPTFTYDPSWPKELPNKWIVGNIGAVWVDAKDHVWIAHRPGGTTNLSERFGLTGEAECCFPAPPVIEFDQAGNVVQAWGLIHDQKGAPLGKQVSGPYPDGAWPTSEHGITVDHKGHVWVDSSTPPSSLLKLSRDGKLLLQIGKTQGKVNSDTVNLGGPTSMLVDAKTNEVFVADGYENRRIIVFDADTGAYKRHWGAYGKPPVEEQAPSTGAVEKMGKIDPAKRREQFDHVHCLAEDKGGLLYVCDRANDRVQVFKKDGTYVREVLVAPETRAFGSVMSVAFSPDAAQEFMYVADGANHKVWIYKRETLELLGAYAGLGAGRGGGQMLVIHTMGVDSKGNLYVGETIPGNRIQRFRFAGLVPLKK